MITICWLKALLISWQRNSTLSFSRWSGATHAEIIFINSSYYWAPLTLMTKIACSFLTACRKSPRAASSRALSFWICLRGGSSVNSLNVSSCCWKVMWRANGQILTRHMMHLRCYRAQSRELIIRGRYADQ